MNTLIVDDERNIRDSIGRLLELEGIQSETASNGQAAVGTQMLRIRCARSARSSGKRS